MKKRIMILISIVLCVVLFVFSCLLVNDNRGLSKVEKALKDLITFPSRIFSREVKIEISSEVTDTMLDERDTDLRELKDILDLNIVNSDFEYINATIINRNSINWFDTVTIDKGEFQEIKKGMSVINKDGFIGEVIKTSDNTSEIKLITSPSFKNKISVVVNGEYGVTTVYDLKSNTLIIDGISDIDKINVGDKVYTSGLTSLYPSGVLIGSVSGKRKDEFSSLKYLEVDLSADVKNSHYLSVIKK